MNCCAANGTNKFFNKYASQYEKYFRKKGLHKEQKYLAEGIRTCGLADAELLEIGCGVGGLHLSLLKEGAARATGFDISERMIATAERLSREMGLANRTHYWHGDFVELHENAPHVDVTMLDKVLCCYEDLQELLSRSLAKTRHVYAVSYPRDRLWARLFLKAGIICCKIFRISFHPYYHSPREVVQQITGAGFEISYERHTVMWAVQVFKRK